MKKYTPNDRLRDARSHRHLSQGKLGEKIGVSARQIGQWERGEEQPDEALSGRLCEFFEMAPEQLGLANPSPHAIIDALIPLPPPVPLVGRERDIEGVRQRLVTSASVTLTAINGLPGVGKTALAVAMAHDRQVRAYFRDGILWAGLGPHPNISAVLNRWGRLLGLVSTEQEPLRDDAAWAHAIHAVLGERKVLLVIDDAWNVKDALNLKVGGPNCTHLVTTRFPTIATQISINAAVVIKELDTDQSMDLLRLLAPGVVESDQGALDLVQAVGGLPLALTLMGNYLRKQTYAGGGQPRRISAAMQRLSNARERLNISEPVGPVERHPGLLTDTALSLQSVIAITDQQLPADAREALYALAVFPTRPNSFSEQAALAVTAGPVEVLDLLIDSGLLESSGADRYSLHQTISDYARAHLSDDTPYRRLVQYVVTFVEEHKKDYELLELESTIIPATLARAYELAMWDMQVRATLAYAPYMLSRGLYAQAEQHMQRAHAAAIELQDQENETKTLIYLGEIAHQWGNLAQAETIFQEGLSIARKLENKEQISALLNDLGWVEEKLGHYTQAEIYLQEGLAIAQQIEDKKRICGILKVLGMVADHKGDFAQGEIYLREGLRLARQIQDGEQICLILINLGASVADQGRFAQAEIFFQEGLKLARQSGYRERICLLLADLGECASRQGNDIQAEQYLREGLEVARQIGYPERMCILLGNLGIVMRKQEKYKLAETYLLESLTVSRSTNVSHMTANILCECGNLYLDQQQIGTAKSYFQEMLKSIPEGSQDLKALAYYGLARAMEAGGDREEAIRLGNSSVTILEKIGHHQATEVKQWLTSVCDG